MSSLNPEYKKIAEIVEKYSDLLLRVAFTYMKNISDSEDMVQEVFLKLVKEYPSFETDEHKKAWLIRVTVNQCKNRLKSAWFRKTEPIYDTTLSFSDEEKFVMNAVMELPSKYRSVILLYYHEGYSIKEISNILEIKESTISSQLQRARSQLKSKLKEDFDYE
ncbi:sigma-70 family RNA polymerase sigma factor [Tissierella sp. Yu-01]|uniref:RNA polymerase sigma factor n=1 Tax=Tissierella sp. Yu-01 TaxID=3035694 RepID=UPI00240CF320|nr:sigma-70 family RNA polymerase sigma factor [Tissierella sp. Yu-01]WFA08784.1 sigma-70 family RNA polymerase sigma factor [Tissierella sp. Yu-01]